jgi:TPR repeat protein
MIVTPTIVESAEGGWRLREAGSIEIQPQADANAATVCPVCGIVGDAEHSFCRRCGARIKSSPNEEAVNRQPVSNEQTYSPSPERSVDQQSYVLPPIIQKTSGPQTKTIFTIIGGIVLLGIVLTIIAVVSTNKAKPIEQKLDNAIARGQLLTPATDSAQTLYYQLKASGASEETLRKYREKLVPLLTDRPYRMIAQLMAPGSDDPPLADWQSAQQAMQWAMELKPGDSPLLARAAYCEGRIAYLSKDDNRAIQSWTRAADADKTWPLPVNGIGLIYFARRNYATARSYYFDAVRRDPNWAYAYNNIGTSYFMERNYSDAKGYYQKAAELAPQWARPHSWLGDIAMKEGNYATAVQEFSLVLDPNATGTKNMDLDKIRRQLDLARERAGFQY